MYIKPENDHFVHKYNLLVHLISFSITPICSTKKTRKLDYFWWNSKKNIFLVLSKAYYSKGIEYFIFLPGNKEILEKLSISKKYDKEI